MSSPARRYRVLQTLGRGGFGVVYRAEVVSQGAFTKQVALKVLRNDVDDVDHQAQRLRDEARILGLLNHRAVVKVDGLVQLSDGWAVVMEYVHGINASVLVQVQCPARPALEIIDEVAGALHAAWALPNEVTGEPLRLIHRDIKPANIRITALGAVKVLDFGVARAEFDERESETLSMRFGSLRYMAPERFDDVDGPAADVFSLTVVLAELLAGGKLLEPPKNPTRFDAWLDDVVEAATDGRPGHERVPLEKLLRDGLAYDEASRPDARQLQNRCRKLAPLVSGPSLRDFAEAEIPDLIRRWAEHADSKSSTDPRTDSVLVEVGSEPTAEVTGMTRSRAVVGAAAAGTAAMGALAAVVVMSFMVVGVATFRSLTRSEPPADETPPEQPPGLPLPPEPAPAAAEEPESAPEPTSDDPPEPAPPAAPAASARPRPAAPRPAAATAGTVTLTGDVAQVTLSGPRVATLSAGDNQVPPGSYEVKAAFDADPIVAGRLSVEGGESTVLHCSAMLYTCSEQ